MGTPQFCFRLYSVSFQNGVSILVSIASTADQRMEVDYIFEQNATLQEMQHQKIMATAKLCAEYDGRLVKNTRNSLSIGHLQPKEAIKFLLDAKFDSADFKKIVRCLLNEDERLDENVQKEKRVAFFKEALSLVGKSKRKIEREIEAYEIANSF